MSDGSSDIKWHHLPREGGPSAATASRTEWEVGGRSTLTEAALAAAICGGCGGGGGKLSRVCTFLNSGAGAGVLR